MPPVFFFPSCGGPINPEVFNQNVAVVGALTIFFLVMMIGWEWAIHNYRKVR